MNNTPKTLIESIFDKSINYEIQIIELPLRKNGNIAKLLLEFKSILEKKE
jgi:hypothetical protein